MTLTYCFDNDIKKKKKNQSVLTSKMTTDRDENVKHTKGNWAVV